MLRMNFQFCRGEKNPEIYIFITNCLIIVKLTIPIANIVWNKNPSINSSIILGFQRGIFIYCNASMGTNGCRVEDMYIVNIKCYYEFFILKISITN